jgi:hypothetical protein
MAHVGHFFRGLIYDGRGNIHVDENSHIVSLHVSARQSSESSRQSEPESRKAVRRHALIGSAPALRLLGSLAQTEIR